MTVPALKSPTTPGAGIGLQDRNRFLHATDDERDFFEVWYDSALIGYVALDGDAWRPLTLRMRNIDDAALASLTDAAAGVVRWHRDWIARYERPIPDVGRGTVTIVQNLV